MEGARVLNLGPNPPRSGTEAPPVESKFSQNEDLIEQTRADVRRMRIQFERQQDEQDSHRQRTKILSVVLGALIVFFAIALWFGYPTLKDQKKTMADTLGLQTASNTLSERSSIMESSLNKLLGGMSSVASRMDRLETDMKSNLDAARSQTQQVGQRIREDVNRSIQSMQSRLTGVESNQKEAAERVTKLQEQVAGLQKELVTTREQASSATQQLKQQLAEAQQSSSKELSGLNQRMVTSQTALTTLSNRVDRKQVRFEIPTRKTEEIAPGIYLTVRHADVGKQQIDGTVQLSASSRLLPIRGESINRPMAFSMSDDNRPIHLVLTEVAKNKVSGYLLMPTEQVVSSK